MKGCIIDSAKIDCGNCGVRYGFDVETQQEGVRVTKCPLCRHEQMVYIAFRAIVVPLPERYARGGSNGRG